MDFRMDRCLQSGAVIKVIASMLIGLSNIGEKRLPVCKFMQCSIFGFCGVKYHVYKTCIILIVTSMPEHCDLQTDISNCLGDIISCPQIDLTLPCWS